MSIEIRGLDKLFKKLGKVAGTEVLVKPTQRATVRLQHRMQEYPPALSPRQGPVSARTGRKGARSFRLGYRRTGTYGRRWTVRIIKSGNGLQGKVGNNVPYGPYVGSKQYQARVHQGRWNTDDQVVREEQTAILADYQREIDRALAEG